MLTKVEIRNNQGSLLTFTLEDDSSGFVVQDIDGLGPVKATIISSSFAQQDGVEIHSASREARNILMKIGIEPDYSTSSVRQLRSVLYSFFMTNANVSMRFFMSDGLTVNTLGRVETCEPSLFSQEPAVNISIICGDPDFLGLDPVVVTGNTTSTTTETLLTYAGTTETGVVLVLNVNRTLSEFTFYHRLPSGILRSIDIAASFVSGDVVTLSTITRDKHVTLTRAGTDSSLLYSKAPQSPWFELENGDNHIRVYATGAAIPYSITYTDRYGGL